MKLWERLKGGVSRAVERRTPERLVVVGVDLGTSGSKVVFRDHLQKGRPAHAIDFGTPSDLGFSRFSWPTSIAMDGGGLYFGAEAESRALHSSAVKCLRSVKTLLLGARPEAVEGGAWEELLGFAGRAGGDPFLVWEVPATLYLASLLRYSNAVIRETFPQIREDELWYNIDVPVSEFGQRARFRRMLGVARLLADDIGQGIRVDSAAELWTAGLLEFHRHDSQNEPKRTFVIAEAHAIMQGIGQAAHAISGDSNKNYAIVDVGAGTVDVGVFRFAPGKDRRIVFYSADADTLGCDQIDEAICASMGIDGRRARAAIRRGKLLLDQGRPFEVPGFGEVPPSSLESALADFWEPCFSHYQHTFRQAFKKEKNTDRWRRLTLFLAGGGSRLRMLRSKLSLPPTWYVRDVRVWREPEGIGIKAVGHSDQNPAPEDLPFLIAGVGLSFQESQFPRLVNPEDFGDDPGGGKGPTGLYDFDWDDLYSP